MVPTSRKKPASRIPGAARTNTRIPGKTANTTSIRWAPTGVKAAKETRPMSARTDRLRRTRGFTLLELLVVLAIMAAIAMAFPLALNRFVAARRADAAATSLFASVRALQMKSAAGGETLRIEVLPNGYQAQDRVVTLNSH